MKHVRALWDIENVPIPSKASVVDVVSSLKQWLSNQGLCGEGVDLRITTMYCPRKSGNAVGTTIAHILDRVGVEQVFCDMKQEDADRKIVQRLLHETLILPPTSTTFVIISGDLDFNSTVSHLVSLGFSVLMICSRRSSDRNLQSFALNATSVSIWEDIIGVSLNDDKVNPLVNRKGCGKIKDNASRSTNNVVTPDAIGDTDSPLSTLEKEVNSFCQWFDQQNETEHPTSLIAKYYKLKPHSSGVFKGQWTHLKSAFPCLDTRLARISKSPVGKGKSPNSKKIKQRKSDIAISKSPNNRKSPPELTVNEYSVVPVLVETERPKQEVRDPVIEAEVALLIDTVWDEGRAMRAERRNKILPKPSRHTPPPVMTKSATAATRLPSMISGRSILQSAQYKPSQGSSSDYLNNLHGSISSNERSLSELLLKTSKW